MTIIATPDQARRTRIEVRGVVQGVGFRPFVYRLAHELALAGWVNNDGAGVTIEVEGDAAQIDSMTRRLTQDAPPLARIDSIAVRDCAPRAESGFAILESVRGHAATAIGPDSAICGDCLAELFDPGDRRYRYAFINCTHCGPRYTITRSLPYDRAMTSMAAFPAVSRMRGRVSRAGASPFSRRAQRMPAVRPATRAGRRRRHSDRRRGSDRRNGCAPAPRRDRRDQGPRRISPGLRCAQRRRRRPAAGAQGARGEAVRGHGGQCRLVIVVRGRDFRRAFAARIPRSDRSCCCARRGVPTNAFPASRRGSRGSARCCRTRRCSICCSTRRRGGRPASAWLDGAAGARAGDDQRQSRRRAAGDRQWRSRPASFRHRRRAAHARPRDRHALR